MQWTKKAMCDDIFSSWQSKIVLFENKMSTMNPNVAVFSLFDTFIHLHCLQSVIRH